MPTHPLADLFAKIKPDDPFALSGMGSWPDSVHVFDEPMLWALRAAITAQRPLLITGEPGSGKSQLARAAAQVTGRAFLSKVVDGRTESRDLHYHFDAVARLGEAQARSFRKQEPEQGIPKQQDPAPAAKLDPLDPLCFMKPEILWWAFAWHSAMTQTGACRIKTKEPATLDGWTPAKGCVVLIDEIDKAEQDLPNGLLETLGNSAFSVPYRDQPIGLQQNPDTPTFQPPPLVFITSNGERELPAAFVRRCMVLHLDLPNAKDPLIEWLVARGAVHQPHMDPTLAEHVAEMLWEDRQDAVRKGVTPPGQAEYLDILKCLTALSETPEGQKTAFEKIRPYAFAKARRI